MIEIICGIYKITNLSRSLIQSILNFRTWKEQDPNLTKEDTKRINKKNQKRKRNSEKCHLSKINWDIVKEIRKINLENDLSIKEISGRFNINEQIVRRVLNNTCWRE